MVYQFTFDSPPRERVLTQKSFSDHFAPVAINYAEFRPTYPAALFDWLASISPNKGLAWDCACGSGQASGDLGGHFSKVIATDASASQISTAVPHEHIEYRVARAEKSGLEAGSVDLVTVAQALHWFDLDGFYSEVRRVLVPEGVVAVWSYGIHSVGEAQIDNAVRDFYSNIVGPYWPPERVHVENGYADLAFPFSTIEPPAFQMTAGWPLGKFLGYLRSWSATGGYIKKHGIDPVDALTQTIAPMWGPAEAARTVTWPLAVRVGKLDPL